MKNYPLKYITRFAEEILSKDFLSGKVILLLGPRQVGKKTLIQHVLRNRKAMFLNFDLEIDKQRFIAASVIDPASAMSSFQNPEFLVIDEVQRLPESVRTVKGWHDSGLPVIFVLLGSSNIEISDRAAESLAGRNIKRVLPPLTFEEIVRAQPWNGSFDTEQIQSQFAPQIDSLLLTCLAFGHYPETVLTEDKRSYLLNLTADVLWKDILHLGLVRTPNSIRRLLTLLAHQVGSEVSVNELSNTLGLARDTVEKYLGLLEQTFIVFRLPAFSSNPRKEISKSQKFYFWDTGIRNALLNEFSTHGMRSDIGALWENWVVAEFARQNLLKGGTKNLYFWRSHAGSEVDLIIRQDDRMQAFEIKWSLQKKTQRAFSDRYRVPVSIINRSTPLFKLEE